jgi:hypothetical protein
MREFAEGDWFATDCILSHAVGSVSAMSQRLNRRGIANREAGKSSDGKVEPVIPKTSAHCSKAKLQTLRTHANAESKPEIAGRLLKPACEWSYRMLLLAQARDRLLGL